MLPCKIIYQLNSEFNCLKELAKKLDPPPTTNEFNDGIPIQKFFKVSRVLKKIHPDVKEKFIYAMGLPSFKDKHSIVDWNNYLKLQSLCRFYTASYEDYIEFWKKVSAFFSDLHSISLTPIIEFD